MIYTITMNPALDYTIVIDDVKQGKMNRAQAADIRAGGKGIHVSHMLKKLGFENRLYGFIGGFTGTEFKARINHIGLSEEFLQVPVGETRVNIKLRGKEETQINVPGLEVPSMSMDSLFQKLNHLRKNDIVVLSGTVPKMSARCFPLKHLLSGDPFSKIASDEDGVYADIMKMLEDKGIQFIVDAKGPLALNTLQFKPLLIKPNRAELADFFQTEIKTKEDAKTYAHKLIDMGAQNVLASLDKDGAVFVGSNGEEFEAENPAGEKIDTVGAGSSMIAGFIAGYMTGHDLEKAFYYAVAAGSATAYSVHLAEKEDVDRLYEELTNS